MSGLKWMRGHALCAFGEYAITTVSCAYRATLEQHGTRITIGPDHKTPAAAKAAAEADFCTRWENRNMGNSNGASHT